MEFRDGSSLIRKSVKSYPRKSVSFLQNSFLKGSSRGTVTKSRRFSHLWRSVEDVWKKLVRPEWSHCSWFFTAFPVVHSLFRFHEVLWPLFSPDSYLRGDPYIWFHQKNWLRTNCTPLERPWKIMKNEIIAASPTLPERLPQNIKDG